MQDFCNTVFCLVNKKGGIIHKLVILLVLLVYERAERKQRKADAESDPFRLSEEISTEEVIKKIYEEGVE